jgi:hypothetical protein
VLRLAAQVSDHYLPIEGELSSSSCGFHPGERQKRRGLRCKRSTMTRSRPPCLCGLVLGCDRADSRTSFGYTVR